MSHVFCRRPDYELRIYMIYCCLTFIVIAYMRVFFYFQKLRTFHFKIQLFTIFFLMSGIALSVSGQVSDDGKEIPDYAGMTYAVGITSESLFDTVSGQVSDDSTVTLNDNTFRLLENLSKSQLATGEIYLFTTTHQDIGWLDQPEVCIINRDTLWLTPFLERLESEPSFRMDIEQSSVLMEYIHRHPDKKALIENYLKEGRICVGATYMQPYEEMYSGESLARQFYLGKRWLKQNFGGYTALSYFNVDVPGRTLQMPQIMARAGVENLIISRHGRGLFHWEAPDGSKVRAYSPGHYIYYYDVLSKSDTAAFGELGKEAVLWYSKFNNVANTKAVMPAMLNYEFIWDQQPVENCGPFTSKWNSIRYIQSEGNKKMRVDLPKIRYATADDFFNALDRSTTGLSSIRGERPNVWLYIHGPSHERAITASRKGDILLPAVEKVASFNALTQGDFMNYPDSRLYHAWEAKIYPDHGWGGKNGDITDLTFLRKYEYAETEAEAMLNEGINSLASQVNTKGSEGIPVIIVNTLSWKRDDPAVVPLRLKKGEAKSVSLKDASGNSVPCQLSNITLHVDGTICTADLHFVAKDIPSMGFSTFYLETKKTGITTASGIDSRNFENEYYRITFTDGGIRQIEDKELGISLFDTRKFQGGEVITMQSVGSGAGEFAKVQQPDMENFDKVTNHFPRWSVKENGEVFTSFFYRSKIRNAVVEQTVTIYHQIKKIDFDIAILNWEGILYREYRMMFPVNIVNGEVAYEVPFGMLRVGKDEMPGAAGERYNIENKEQRPRGIGNWIGVSGKDFGVTLSSSAAVADYCDPTDNPVINTVLQPILFASRKSCHMEGNEYLQIGDHFFHFSLTSHAPGWNQSYRFGQSSNEKLRAVFAPKAFKEASLPQSFSFFDLQNKHVIISTIKKCEDDESLIIRLYNTSDQTETVKVATQFTPKEIIRVNLIEEELEKVNEMILGKFAIETFKLKY